MFVVVAETLSFSESARRLGTATATVSRGISALEEAVGTELIHRTTRDVSLSTAGATLYERVAPHVRGLQAAVRGLPERQEDPAGSLRISAPYAFGATLLGPIVARFMALYPDVQVEADFTNRNVDIVAGGFDLAIRADVGAQRDSSLTVRRVVQHGWLHYYASPSYVTRRGSPRALGAAGHDWLVSNFALQRRLPDLPKSFKPRIVANDFLFLCNAARAHAGIAMLPAFIAGPHISTGELVRVLGTARLRAGGLVLLYPSSGQLARKVVAFRDLLVKSIKRDAFE